MSQDNPILNTINDTLGLGRPPKTFSEKAAGLRQVLGLEPGTHYRHAIRGDKHLGAGYGSWIASDTHSIQEMYDYLSSSNRLPGFDAKKLFEHVDTHGGAFIFNEPTQSLYFSTGDRVSPLPIQGKHGRVHLAGQIRKTNSIRDIGSPEGYVESFYARLYTGLGSDIGSPHKAISDLRSSSFRSMLLGGVTERGMFTPEEALWTSSLKAVEDMPGGLSLSLQKHKLGTIAFSQLVKSGGRSVNEAFQNLSGTKLDYNSAFGLARRYREGYIAELSNYLESTGDPSSFVFVKPEYLGTKSKFLMASSGLSQRWGTQFESHTLSKGLFQLSKMRRTTSSQIASMMDQGLSPYSPYMLKGDSDMFRMMGLRVGVVDTTNAAASRLLFQEGGAIFTPTGAAKFAMQTPMGSLKIKAPSEELIGAIERLYGINMGAGYNQTPNAVAQFSKSDLRAAREAMVLEKEIRAFDPGAFYPDLTESKLTPIQKDLKLLLQSSGKGTNLYRQIARNKGILGKINLNESMLRMDFTTAEAHLPGSLEFVAAGRRFTGVMPDTDPLKGLISKEAYEGIDVFIGADEFNKTMAANAYLTNFIDKVKDRKDAEAIFRQTFGDIHVAGSGKRRTVIPIITNHDSAFKHAQTIVSQWSNGRDNHLRDLADKIEHGTKVTTNQMLNSGIKGIRVFGLGGAVRTDFMGDINMMNPIRITPSKMMVTATAARQLGYATPYDDPLFGIMAEMSAPWRTRQIGIRAASGELFFSNKHLMRRFSRAMLAKPINMDPSQIVTMGPNGFSIGGKQLSRLPSLEKLSHRSGGVPFNDLTNTLLGQAQDMLYIDLGGTKSLDLLGTGAKNYRYLPVPLQYLRTQQGVHDSLVVQKGHPAHDLLQALHSIEGSTDFYGDVAATHEASLKRGYNTLIRSLAGKEGTLALTNTILMNMGTRARLAPLGGKYFNEKSFSNVDELFNVHLSASDFEDYLYRKSGVGKAAGQQSRLLRDMVRKQGYFYASVSVDPMQRAEHSNVFKVFVDRSARRTKGIGQLNLNMHPYWYRMSERDTDRDVANFIPLTGIETRFGQEDLEKRLARQKKLSQHFIWFHQYEMRKAETLSSLRFSIMGIITKATDYLSDFLGVPKSLGYSLTRASDTVMNTIAGYGVRGAGQLGILGKNITPEIIEKIAKPFVDDPELLSVTQKIMQNLYQGGVAKGTSKGGLIGFAEKMVGIGQKYKDNFDYDAIVSETAAEIKTFLSGPGMKDRSFMALDFLAKKGLLDSESTALMKKDLERGLNEVLSDAAQQRVDRTTATIIDAQAHLLAQNIGPGMVIAASTPAVKSPIGIIRKVVTDETDAKDLQASIIDASSGLGRSKETTMANNIGGQMAEESDTLLGEVEASIKKTKFFEKAKSYFKGSNARMFGLGLGAGALVGAAAVHMFSSPPMPREVDGRQPTDAMPEVYSPAPKLYGSNQNFATSNSRYSNMSTSPARYSFPNMGSSNITLRDKTSPMNPHLIDRYMRDVANSDYTY